MMVDPSTRDRLLRNWQRTVDDVGDACVRVGRDPGEVLIVGVSKYVDTETTEALARTGCLQLGESRPQSLWQKAEWFDNHPVDSLRWHLIGHLQRNKVRRLLRQDVLIHSIDSDRILASVAEASAALGKSTEILIEVNVSADRDKTGLSEDRIESVVTAANREGVHLLGLMAMAGWGTDPGRARKQFAQVRVLRDRLERSVGVSLPQLSMGMSGDFPEAIAEGATMVRIGSRLFEGIRTEAGSRRAID